MRRPLLDRLIIALLGGAVAAGALVALGFRRGDSPAPTVIDETPASTAAAGFSPRAIYARDAAGSSTSSPR